MDRELVWYIAGPMSNVPQFNIPTFDRVASALRTGGYKVVSPAELDDDKIRNACLASPDGASTPETHGGGTWADFLARDVKLIADQVGGIAFLPMWFTSRGARLEAFVGLLTGKKFARWSDTTNDVVPVDAEWVRTMMRVSMP